jgi:hypothetical protein
MSLSSSHRVLVIVGAAAGACAIAVPAALGLSGNPSFSQRIPVRAPSSAHIVTVDDHSGAASEAVHTRHGHREVARRDDDRSSTAPGGRETEPGDDRGDRRGADDGNRERNRGDDGTHDGSGNDGSGGGHDGGGHHGGGHDGGSDG